MLKLYCKIFLLISFLMMQFHDLSPLHHHIHHFHAHDHYKNIEYNLNQFSRLCIGSESHQHSHYEHFHSDLFFYNKKLDNNPSKILNKELIVKDHLNEKNIRTLFSLLYEANSFQDVLILYASKSHLRAPPNTLI